MKSGMNLVDLAQQITNEQKAKRDFITPTTRLEYHRATETAPRGTITFGTNGSRVEVQPTDNCLKQICERVGIPQRYADKMSGDHAELLETNINHWFTKDSETRMVRTLIDDDRKIARAFLSDRYRPLDNDDLAKIVLPELIKGGCEVLSSQITETRLYIQAATPRVQFDLEALKKERGIGLDTHARRPLETDFVQAGVVISNSEVGRGALKVEPMLYRLVCYNGLILPTSMKRYHVGRAGSDSFAELEQAAEYFTNETRQLDDKAFWAKVRDVVSGVFDLGKFESLAVKFAETGAIALPSPSDAVVEIGKRFKLTDGEEKSVLDQLIAGGDNSMFGLVNAVTRASTDVADYDRAVEMERIGGEIIELGNIWSKN